MDQYDLINFNIILKSAYWKYFGSLVVLNISKCVQLEKVWTTSCFVFGLNTATRFKSIFEFENHRVIFLFKSKYKTLYKHIFIILWVALKNIIK